MHEQLRPPFRCFNICSCLDVSTRLHIPICLPYPPFASTTLFVPDCLPYLSWASVVVDAAHLRRSDHALFVSYLCQGWAGIQPTRSTVWTEYCMGGVFFS